MLRIAAQGVGVDIEDVSRFEGMDMRLVSKIFTKDEIAYCNRKVRPAQGLAARFAAKEAVVKCLGSIGKRVLFDKIEILNKDNGAPVVKILGEGLSGYEVKVSLSHTADKAIAFAVVSRKKEVVGAFRQKAGLQANVRRRKHE
jgi:holo-[acyl-carrier-protein] synthase